MTTEFCTVDDCHVPAAMPLLNCRLQDAVGELQATEKEDGDVEELAPVDHDVDGDRVLDELIALDSVAVAEADAVIVGEPVRDVVSSADRLLVVERETVRVVVGELVDEYSRDGDGDAVAVGVGTVATAHNALLTPERSRSFVPTASTRRAPVIERQAETTTDSAVQAPGAHTCRQALSAVERADEW